MQGKMNKIARVAVPGLDECLGNPFQILDDGFIRVIDYMGSDASVVQAARVSYGAGTKQVHEDRGLIRYLMRHHHTTPFEMCEIKLHVRVPMDCWRQWIRHRTANVNEYSTRYSIAIDASQKTKPDQWRQQSDKNKQGSEGFLDVRAGEILSEEEVKSQNHAREVYERRVKMGVAREQARKDLPLSTYTEAFWKIDLFNLLHFLELRMDMHAQYEIRQYANVIGYEVVKKWCPLVWEAFEDYRLKAVHLSKLDVDIISALNLGNKVNAIEIASSSGVLQYVDGKLKPNRERTEIELKLRNLGFSIPW